MIFAEELPLSDIVPSQAVTIVIVLVVVGFIVNLVGAVVIVLAFVRRKPSIESEFATKKEMAEGFSRVDRDINALSQRNEHLSSQIFDKIDGLSSTVNTVFREIERRLGRMEGPE